jgi:hypothetical protein
VSPGSGIKPFSAKTEARSEPAVGGPNGMAIAAPGSTMVDSDENVSLA